MQCLAYMLFACYASGINKIEEGSDNQWKLLGTQTKWLYDPVVGQSHSVHDCFTKLMEKYSQRNVGLINIEAAALTT